MVLLGARPRHSLFCFFLACCLFFGSAPSSSGEEHPPGKRADVMLQERTLEFQTKLEHMSLELTQASEQLARSQESFEAELRRLTDLNQSLQEELRVWKISSTGIIATAAVAIVAMSLALSMK